jgi:hypothetical protein
MRRCAVVMLLALIAVSLTVRAAEISYPKLILPLGRSAYQTNEMIDVSVVRRDPAAIPAGELVLTITGLDDGSKATIVFPAKAIAVEGSDARATEHLHINGRLLRPGRYQIHVKVDARDVATTIDVHSHVRRSTFKTIDWGSQAKDAEQRLLGEDGLGFNLLYYSYGGLNPDETIRGGLDYMRNDAMGGGHQLDLRHECDWSDPYALQGAAARATRQAMEDRTRPNCVGVHFYDEPGLTWLAHPKTGVNVPYNIPAQDRAYQRSFGAQPPQYNDTKPNDSPAVAKWLEMNRWKLSIMEAAWKIGKFGMNEVRPDFLAATQSMYAFDAYTDGHYFNVVRPLPVISGHGGYDDGVASYFYPSYHLEFGRMRDGLGINKPVWYLPTWYQQPPELYRLEQYLSFQNHLQGLCKPPGLLAHKPSQTPEAEAILETNTLTRRLGTIFTTMPVTRPPVAQLYSLSQNLTAQVRDMQNPNLIDESAYDGGGHNRRKTIMTYLAGKAIHVPIFPIVEEDVLDGTLAAHHRVVVLPGIDTLDPKVISALEAFNAGGGVVLVSDDSKVQIQGATKIGAPVKAAQLDLGAELRKQKKYPEAAKEVAAARLFKENMPFAHALRERLAALGIAADIECDQPMVITSRQAQGDVEYLFAVNAVADESTSDPLAIKAIVANIAVAHDARPIYDAIRGGEAKEFNAVGKKLSAAIRFGPGQMRAFARTARPIGAVQVSSPTISCDYTAQENPLHAEFSAMVMDASRQMLCGSIPLQIKVIDPLGATRDDLYRATDKGICRIDLQLAANDPPGEWEVVVTELLNNTTGNATFNFTAPKQVGALAGATPRAVYFGNDREQIFRFFRTFEDVTIVAGKGDYSAAIERITTSLKPWDVRCRVMSIDEASKPRQISSDASSTWVGLIGGVSAEQKSPPGPQSVGFAVQGPVILLGTPEDNPIIRFGAEKKFLPYTPDAETFPGRGRGMIAWQRDMVGYQQESITLIGYDPAGISEAIGTMYEAGAGLDPLMPLTPPARAEVAPAVRALASPAPRIAWRATLADRAISMTAGANGVEGLSADQSRFMIDASGKVTTQPDSASAKINSKNLSPKLPDAIARASPVELIPKALAEREGHTVVAYWGGTLIDFDPSGHVQSKTRVDQDITQIAWLQDLLVVALSDGRVLAMKL